jgi:phospholipid/cholesterol/gamma-HCH transport system ATP-binding protein
VRSLKAGYGSRVVLKSVSFAMRPREIRVILGTSGCGKSTLLNNILGLERPLAGEIELLGVHWKAGELFPQNLRERCGVLFQNGALLSSLSVYENVALPLRMHRKGVPESVVQDIVASKLASVNMLHAWHRLPSELSGGMRKRAALARAIALDPEILFCDEPSAGLDPVTSRSLDDLLLRLQSDLGLSIVIVTHELDSIRTLNGHLLFLQSGEVLLDAPLEEGLRSEIPQVRDFFARKAEGTESGLLEKAEFEFV